MTTPILYDTHMHTPLCKHAEGLPTEYAAQAERRGLAGIIVTDHSPMPDGMWSSVRMDPDQLSDYIALVEQTRAQWAGRVDVRLGLESDFMPGLEPWLEKLHARADWDYVLGSVHPQSGEYQQRYMPNGDVIAFQRTYFEHLAQAAETGLFDTLSHPDLVKIMFPEQWNVAPLMDTIRRSLDRIAATGVAMELNTSGLQKSVAEMNPGPEMLAEMCQRGIPVVVGADAHNPRRVAADFQQAFDLLEAAGYTDVNFFLKRTRHTVSLDAARASLRA